MATFPTPEDQELEEGFRCLVVFVPKDSKALFFANLLGQYSELLRPYRWDGSYEYRGKVSQLWQEAYARTMLWIESGDCEEVIDEDGNMSINVNVECGGGQSSSGGDCIQTVTVLPYNPGGSTCMPIETVPVLPPDVPPLVDDGTGVQIPDPIYPSDPPYQGTPGEYDADRCEMAEFAFSMIESWVTEWKKADNLALTIASVLLFLNSSGVTAVIAILLRVSASELIQLVASFIEIGHLVNTWDEWVDDILAVLQSKKQDFICGVYTTLDTKTFMQSWAAEVVQDVLNVWQGRPDWQVTLFQAANTYLQLLFPATPMAAMARLNRVSAGFVPTFDCGVCSQTPQGWTINNAETHLGSGATYTLTPAPTGFNLVGNLERENNTNLSIAVWDEAIMNGGENHGVSFDISVSMSVQNYLVTFGKPGSSHQITEGDFTGHVLVTDGTLPESGYDLVVTVPQVDIKAYFLFGWFTYQPPPVNVDMTISNFTVYPV